MMNIRLTSSLIILILLLLLLLFYTLFSTFFFFVNIDYINFPLSFLLSDRITLVEIITFIAHYLALLHSEKESYTKFYNCVQH